MPRKKIPCAICGQPMENSSTTAPAGEAAHRQCRQSRPKVLTHGKVLSYQNGCRCAECREAKRADQLKYRASRKERTGLAQGRRGSRVYLDARCVGCGGTVRGRYDKDRPYHAACKRREARLARARRKLEHAAAGSVGNTVWTAGECANCGLRFVRSTPHPYCSTKCRRRHASPSGRLKISRGHRLAIYERDSWVCQLCFEPVDPDLHYLDDWAASLDHIVCQSWTLLPDHSPENLRLAHRWCNSVRGNEQYYTAEDLTAA